MQKDFWVLDAIMQLERHWTLPTHHPVGKYSAGVTSSWLATFGSVVTIKFLRLLHSVKSVNTEFYRLIWGHMVQSNPRLSSFKATSYHSF